MNNIKGPIFEVINMICDGGPDGNMAYKVFSYKDSKHFCHLWGLDDSNGHSENPITTRLKSWAKEYKNKELTIVIVWDGMPDAGDILDVSRFVSPHDWAMVVSWIIYDENSCLQDMKLRVLILNVAHSASSFASQSLFAFQNALPWIQDYRVVGSENTSKMTQTLDASDDDQKEESRLGLGGLLQMFVGPTRAEDDQKLKDSFRWRRQALPPEDRDVEMFVEDLLNPSRVLTTHPVASWELEHYVELTKNLWEQELLKAETRHSIANLVAPAILADGLPNGLSSNALEAIAGESLMRRALIAGLSEVGFLKTSLDGSPTEQGGLLNHYCKDQGDIFRRMENIRFVLVDDHFDLGYHHILGYTIFGDNYCLKKWSDTNVSSIYTSANPSSCLRCYKNLDWLIDHINTLFPSPICDWNQPRYLFENECDVLFLDLRLWEEKEDSRNEVMKKIICAANRLMGDTAPEDVHSELKQALRKTEDAVNGEDSFPPEALTLLPLLLSCIDRTLPILLFTSSHQRIVMEMLRDFPNIITSFVKPLVSGYGETISPADSMSDLVDATEKAIALHEARIVWKRICELNPTTASFIYKNRGIERNMDVCFNRDQIRPRLVELFKTCVFGDPVYESISLPWEFLEYEIVQCVDNYYYETFTLHLRSARDNVAKALRETRNAKTHGNLDRDSFRDLKARRVAVLQLLFLLDFFEGCDRNNCAHMELNHNFRELLHVYQERGIGSEYVLGILVEGVETSGSRQFLNLETERAMRNLIRSHLNELVELH